MDQKITSSLFRRMLIVIAIDIIINGLLVLIFPIEGLPGMFVIIFIFLFCILLFAVISYLEKRYSIYLLANIILLPAILVLFVLLSLKIKADIRYHIKDFKIGITRYRLNINKIHRTYEISKIMNADNTWFNGLISGTTIERTDNTILINPDHQIWVSKDTLYGFPKSGIKVKLE